MVLLYSFSYWLPSKKQTIIFFLCHFLSVKLFLLDFKMFFEWLKCWISVLSLLITLDHFFNIFNGKSDSISGTQTASKDSVDVVCCRIDWHHMVLIRNNFIIVIQLIFINVFNLLDLSLNLWVSIANEERITYFYLDIFSLLINLKPSITYLIKMVWLSKKR
jgi:hypothetical protein